MCRKRSSYRSAVLRLWKSFDRFVQRNPFEMFVQDRSKETEKAIARRNYERNPSELTLGELLSYGGNFHDFEF